MATIKINETVFFSTLLYGGESRKKVKSGITAMGVAEKDKTRNDAISRKKLQVTYIITLIDERQIDWFGQTRLLNYY